MADETKKGNEPQSYGGQKEWGAGKTGSQVDGSQKKSAPADPFYENSHETTASLNSEGGRRSPVDQEQDRLARLRTERPSPRVADVAGESEGHRGSFFKNRDYSGS